MNDQGFTKKQKSLAAALRDIAVLIGERQETEVSLETGGTIIPGLGLCNDAKSLATCTQDIEQGLFQVMTLGSFKNGKSTLLNALLGNDMLITKTVPATAIITVLVYGKSQEVAVYYQGKSQPKMLDFEEFKQEFQLTKEDREQPDKQQYVNRFKDVGYAQIECLHRCCSYGVRLVDSPGLGDHASRTKVTTNFLEQSQAVIMVLDAIHLLNEEERKFIDDHFTSGQGNSLYPGPEQANIETTEQSPRQGPTKIKSNVFFVVNRANQIAKEQDLNEVKEHLRTFLAPRFHTENGQFDKEFYARRVFFVDALGALNARLSIPVDSVQLEASGILPFEQELEQFLTSDDERVAAALENIIPILTTCNANARQIIKEKREELDRLLANLKQRRQEVKKELQELEAKKKAFEQRIDPAIEEVKEYVFNSLRKHIQEMKESWPEKSEIYLTLEDFTLLQIQLVILSRKGREALARVIQDGLEKYLEKEMLPWIRRIADRLEKGPGKMTTELEELAQDLQFRYRRRSEYYGFLAVDEVPLTVDWYSLIDAMSVSLSFAGIFGGIGFFGWILAIIVLPLIPILGATIAAFSTIALAFAAIVLILQLKAIIRKKVGEELFKHLYQYAEGPMGLVIRNDVQQAFSLFAQRVKERLQGYIADLEKDMQQIPCKYLLIRQEKKRLSALECKLTKLVELVLSYSSKNS